MAGTDLRIRSAPEDEGRRVGLEAVQTPRGRALFSGDEGQPIYSVEFIDLVAVDGNAGLEKAAGAVKEVYDITGTKVSSVRDGSLVAQLLPADLPYAALLRMGKESFEFLDPRTEAVLFEIPFFRVWAWTAVESDGLLVLHVDWPKAIRRCRVYNAGLRASSPVPMTVAVEGGVGRLRRAKDGHPRALSIPMHSDHARTIAETANRLSYSLVGEKEAMGVTKMELSRLYDVVRRDGDIAADVMEELRRLGFDKALDATQACSIVELALREEKSSDDIAALLHALFRFLAHAEVVPIVLAEVDAATRLKVCKRLGIDVEATERHYADPTLPPSAPPLSSPSLAVPAAAIAPGDVTFEVKKVKRRGSFLSSVRNAASSLFRDKEPTTEEEEFLGGAPGEYSRLE